MPLTPVAAWVVVMSHSLVLFLFASEGLEYLLAKNGLPTVPLVPVSSSQAVVGAVIGIGLLKGGAQINWTVAGRIASGWIITPVIATAVCVLTLFFVQNLFLQTVSKPIEYQVGTSVIERLREEEFPVQRLQQLEGELFSSAAELSRRLNEINNLTSEQKERVLDLARVLILHVDIDRLNADLSSALSPTQLSALKKLDGQEFEYQWQLEESLARREPEWRLLEDITLNKHHNKEIQTRLALIEKAFE